MRNTRLLVLALTLAVAGCTQTASPTVANDPKAQAPPEDVFKEDLAEAQTRINRHFANVVSTTGLKDCLSRVQGEGLVAVDFIYTKSGGNWTFSKAGATKSNLDKSQDAVALECLTAAMGNASFPVETGNSPEAAPDTFLVRWTWPVPLPPTSDQVAARMIGGGGLGADISGCSACVRRTEYPYGLKCEDRERGGQGDCREHSSNVCSTAPTACLRGSYGVAGGRFIF